MANTISHAHLFFQFLQSRRCFELSAKPHQKWVKRQPTMVDICHPTNRRNSTPSPPTPPQIKTTIWFNINPTTAAALWGGPVQTCEALSLPPQARNSRRLTSILDPPGIQRHVPPSIETDLRLRPPFRRVHCDKDTPRPAAIRRVRTAISINSRGRIAAKNAGAPHDDS